MLTKLPLWRGLSAKKSRKFLFLNIFILFLNYLNLLSEPLNRPVRSQRPFHCRQRPQGGAGAQFWNQCSQANNWNFEIVKAFSSFVRKFGIWYSPQVIFSMFKFEICAQLIFIRFAVQTQRSRLASNWTHFLSEIRTLILNIVQANSTTTALAELVHLSFLTSG